MGAGSALRREFSGWKTWQALWMGFSVAVILGVSLYQGDSPVGIIAAVTGVICVILCGMGKLSSYLFGTVNTVLYAYMAWLAGYYGDVMLNLLYYFPTNILGWILWSRNMNPAATAVIMKRMTLRQSLRLLLVCILAVAGYGWFLDLIGGSLPFADSMTTVLSVIAQILMIKRFAGGGQYRRSSDVVRVSGKCDYHADLLVPECGTAEFRRYDRPGSEDRT